LTLDGMKTPAKSPGKMGKPGTPGKSPASQKTPMGAGSEKKKTPAKKTPSSKSGGGDSFGGGDDDGMFMAVPSFDGAAGGALDLGGAAPAWQSYDWNAEVSARDAKKAKRLLARTAREAAAAAAAAGSDGKGTGTGKDGAGETTTNPNANAEFGNNKNKRKQPEQSNGGGAAAAPSGFGAIMKAKKAEADAKKQAGSPGRAWQIMPPHASSSTLYSLDPCLLSNMASHYDGARSPRACARVTTRCPGRMPDASSYTWKRLSLPLWLHTIWRALSARPYVKAAAGAASAAASPAPPAKKGKVDMRIGSDFDKANVLEKKYEERRENKKKKYAATNAALAFGGGDDGRD